MQCSTLVEFIHPFAMASASDVYIFSIKIIANIPFPSSWKPHFLCPSTYYQMSLDCISSVNTNYLEEECPLPKSLPTPCPFHQDPMKCPLSISATILLQYPEDSHSIDANMTTTMSTRPLLTPTMLAYPLSRDTTPLIAILISTLPKNNKHHLSPLA